MSTLRFVTLFASAVFSIAPAVAAPFVRLDMALKVDNGKVASPRILVESGHAATITSVEDNGVGYEINATPVVLASSRTPEAKIKDSISIAFKVYSVNHGEKELMGEPQVITIDGMSTSVTQEGLRRMELSVTPTIVNSAAR